ncbi:hypothetical protein SDC9_181018 [bioreactor metagenome]|uniref:Uncharacterized protein n=1 Tax=bioreactor metagenome TaxID=1076179 RepID=A0A645H4C3_9ZZZZ
MIGDDNIQFVFNAFDLLNCTDPAVYGNNEICSCLN